MLSLSKTIVTCIVRTLSAFLFLSKEEKLSSHERLRILAVMALFMWAIILVMAYLVINLPADVLSSVGGLVT